MIVGTLNVRDLGSRVKRWKIRESIISEKLDFLALQESKLESVSDSLIHCLWNSTNCDWVFVPAVGNSGGVISIWRKSLFSLVFSFSGCGFVGVCLDGIVDHMRCFVVNIYAKCNLPEKRQMWSELLMSKRGFGGGLWCIVGDFNSFRNGDERMGIRYDMSTIYSREMGEFDGFVEELGLIDMPLVGRRFTWLHPNGLSMSRLDRVLLSAEWLSK
jgi:hypothetical protein